MRTMLILCNLFFITACASTMQATSISEASKKDETHEFKRTLELSSVVENTKETTPEPKAELTYLKAQTHESLDQPEITGALRIL